MASTGINNGTLVKLYMDGVVIDALTSNGFSLSHALRAATTKDSAGWEESLEGLRSFEFSCDGYFAEDSTVGQDEFLAEVVTTRAAFTVRESSAVVGDKYIEGECYITSYSKTSGLEESQTWSLSLKGTGALTVGTVS